MKTAIVVTFQVEGTHRWPECPFEDVAFLREKHRHIFHVRATKQVTHSDRQVEIIRLKRSMLMYADKFGGDFGRASCEDMAEHLVEKFDLITCQVLEDNENGAVAWI